MDPEEKKAQHARFLETARALGCDEDEAAFDEKLKTVTKPLPAKCGNPSGDRTKPGGNRRKP